MSAFLCEPCTFDAIAQACVKHKITIRLTPDELAELRATFGPDVSAYASEPARAYWTARPGDEPAIAYLLHLENWRSLQYRYPDVPEYVGDPDPHTFQPVYRRHPPQALANVIRCLNYQSCEHPGWNDSIPRRFLDGLMWCLWDEVPGHRDAPWGFTEKDRGGFTLQGPNAA